MTCEVIVMNRTGAAVAADTAVTMGNKIFHHSQKLFPLAPEIPVALLNYGCAEFMGVPWSLIFSSYARQHDGRKFERLEDYATDFLKFVESSARLFPERVQTEWFKSTVESYWRANFAPGQARQGRNSLSSRLDRPKLAKLLQKDAGIWKHYDPLGAFNPEFVDEILAGHAETLSEISSDLFGPDGLTPSLDQGLRECVRSMYSRDWFAPGDRSWIVICGLGEAEYFPSMLEYQVGSIMGSKLRYAQSDDASVTRKESAVVIPLAQRHTVDMFFRGIDPRLDSKLADHVATIVEERHAFRGKRLSRKTRDLVRSEFRKKLARNIVPDYTGPLIAAIDALGPTDLAKTAEVLVNLTALKMRLSVEERETVGGAVDVAFLSKSNGFSWIKHYNQLPNCHD